MREVHRRGDITARHTPECTNDPTRTYARFVEKAQTTGATGSSTQSNWVS